LAPTQRGNQEDPSRFCPARPVRFSCSSYFLVLLVLLARPARLPCSLVLLACPARSARLSCSCSSCSIVLLGFPASPARSFRSTRPVHSARPAIPARPVHSARPSRPSRPRNQERVSTLTVGLCAFLGR
jgi:hypothetical protein